MMATTTRDATSSLSDAVSTFTKSIKQTLAEVQKQARAEALQSTQALEAERDDLTEAISRASLELQQCKKELASSEASRQQAELTISHQAQTILQLRREVSQWRDQSQNWQEHFLRVEEERCGLSSRLDELITGQSMFAMSLATLPKYPASAAQSSSSSTSTSTTTPPQDVLPHASVANKSLPTPRSITKQLKTPRTKRREAASSDSANTNEEPPKRPTTSKSATRASTAHNKHIEPDVVIPISQKVIRRVQAVYDVPVKEEEDSEPEITPTSSASTSNKGRSNTNATATTTTKPRRSLSQSKRRVIREDSSEGEDANQDEDDRAPRAHGEDDDDELMLGATIPNKRHQNDARSRTQTTSKPSAAPPRKRKQPDVERNTASKIRKVP